MDGEKREIESKETRITGIRSAPTHALNPFLAESEITEIRGRKKKYSIASRADLVMSPEGEVKAGIEHTIVKVVDDETFVKMYEQGVIGMHDLNASGKKVFHFLFKKVQENPNVDRLYLYFMDAIEEPWSISKPVFFRGMAELLEKKFIARSSNPNIFFMNPKMMFNGDRFRLIQEFRRARKTDRLSVTE
jgi:hypothetical protein